MNFTYVLISYLNLLRNTNNAVVRRFRQTIRTIRSPISRCGSDASEHRGQE